MLRPRETRHNAQALVELTIFSSILLFVLGLFVQYGMSMNFQQNLDMTTFRSGMKEAYEAPANIAQEVDIMAIENKPIPDAEGQFGIPIRSPFVSQSSAVWSQHLFSAPPYAELEEPISIDDFYEEYSGYLPRVKLKINGKSYTFSTADYRRLELRLSDTVQEKVPLYNQKTYWDWEDIYVYDMEENGSYDVDGDGQEEQVLLIFGQDETGEYVRETSDNPSSDGENKGENREKDTLPKVYIVTYFEMEPCINGVDCWVEVGGAIKVEIPEAKMNDGIFPNAKYDIDGDGKPESIRFVVEKPEPKEKEEGIAEPKDDASSRRQRVIERRKTGSDEDTTIIVYVLDYQEGELGVESVKKEHKPEDKKQYSTLGQIKKEEISEQDNEASSRRRSVIERRKAGSVSADEDEEYHLKFDGRRLIRLEQQERDVWHRREEGIEEKGVIKNITSYYNVKDEIFLPITINVVTQSLREQFHPNVREVSNFDEAVEEFLKGTQGERDYLYEFRENTKNRGLLVIYTGFDSSRKKREWVTPY